MYDNAVRNETGLIACRFYMPVPKYIQANGRDYVCNVNHGVSLLFVPEAEVQGLLDYLGGCCGQKRKVFSICSPEAYNVWLTGNR